MKVPDTVIKIKELELVEFMDSVQVILNNGLYETRIFSSVPTWPANEGESAIYTSGTVNDLYFMINATWNRIRFGAQGNVVLFDSDGDTGITPEATLNENVIRFYTGGFYNFGMGTAGMWMAPGKSFFFDGTNGTGALTYLVSSASGYVTIAAGTQITLAGKVVGLGTATFPSLFVGTTQITGNGGIPQLNSDPITPAAESSWVLKSGGGGTGGGKLRAFFGMGFPYLIVSTGGGAATYQFSYRTKEGTTKRVAIA